MKGIRRLTSRQEKETRKNQSTLFLLAGHDVERTLHFILDPDRSSGGRYRGNSILALPD